VDNSGGKHFGDIEGKKPMTPETVVRSALAAGFGSYPSRLMASYILSFVVLALWGVCR